MRAPPASTSIASPPWPHLLDVQWLARAVVDAVGREGGGRMRQADQQHAAAIGTHVRTHKQRLLQVAVPDLEEGTGGAGSLGCGAGPGGGEGWDGALTGCVQVSERVGVGVGVGAGVGVRVCGDWGA